MPPRPRSVPAGVWLVVMAIQGGRCAGDALAAGSIMKFAKVRRGAAFILAEMERNDGSKIPESKL